MDREGVERHPGQLDNPSHSLMKPSQETRNAEEEQHRPRMGRRRAASSGHDDSATTTTGCRILDDSNMISHLCIPPPD